MARYTFLNIPAWGHVNPSLAVVQELVKRGHEVSYYLTEEFRGTIQATGAHFEPYESTMTAGIPGVPQGGSGPHWMLADQNFVPSQITERIRAENPDVIIYDFMGGWAKSIVEELQVPAIALRPTYASNEHFNVMENMRNIPAGKEFVERIRARFSASGEQGDKAVYSLMQKMFSMFASYEQFNIMFIPRFFQPMEKTFDKRFIFVGPSILPRHQETPFPFDQLHDELPLLYISLGTVASDQPEFYKQCFAAFGDQAWQVVLSIGKNVDVASLGPIPTNFLLSSYIPQLDILPRTQIFVTHGGTNSVLESLYYGVPMVLIPQQPEQYMHAQRVVDLGAGTLLEKNAVNPTTLYNAVDHIAGQAQYRKQAETLRQTMRDAGGYREAADAIIKFTQEHSHNRSQA